MEIIRITNDEHEVLEPEWLARAEAVHRQLRPHLPTDYAGKMKRVFATGGEMCIAVAEDRVVGVAVFRDFENTHVGHKFYVDDLVTDEARRSRGVGHALIGWLERLARERGCPALELDSGTHRTQAHRFYFREGFVIPSFCFKKDMS